MRVVHAVTADAPNHINGQLFIGVVLMFLLQLLLSLNVVGVLLVYGQIIGAQLLYVHLDTLQTELARLSLNCLGNAFASLCAARRDYDWSSRGIRRTGTSVLYLPLSRLQLWQRDWSSAAALWLCIVRRSSWPLLGVLLLAPLGTTILKPNLQ